MIATSEEDPELEQQEIIQLLARRVDALIIASTQATFDISSRIDEQKVPYVLIDRRAGQLTSNFVGVDDHAVGMMATEHLLQAGCTRIACLYGMGLSPARASVSGISHGPQKTFAAGSPLRMTAALRKRAMRATPPPTPQ